METFWTLLTDPAHWEFEIFLIIIFDVILGIFVWPFIQRALMHQKSDSDRLTDLEKEVRALQRIKK